MKNQYIDKSIIIAEIKRLQCFFVNKRDGFEIGYHHGLDMILSFLDNIEEKKDDMEDIVHATVDYPLIGCDFPNIYPNYKEFKEYCDRKAIKDNDKVKLIIIKDMQVMTRKDEDLEKEIIRVSKNEYFDFTDWKSIARHFYEFGLKSQKGE